MVAEAEEKDEGEEKGTSGGEQLHHERKGPKPASAAVAGSRVTGMECEVRFASRVRFVCLKEDAKD
jgi:hypothetical protein